MKNITEFVRVLLANTFARTVGAWANIGNMIIKEKEEI